MKPHLEPDTENGREIEAGRDPRRLSTAQLNAMGHTKQPVLDVIRQNCLDCCVQSAAEVRRCTFVTCPMWPYRMGTNPFASKDYTPEQRQAARDRLVAARAKIAKNQLSL